MFKDTIMEARKEQLRKNDLIDAILNLETEEEITDYIDKLNISIDEFKNKISQFITNHPNHPKLNEIKDISQKIIQMYQEKKGQIYTYNEVNQLKKMASVPLVIESYMASNDIEIDDSVNEHAAVAVDTFNRHLQLFADESLENSNLVDNFMAEIDKRHQKVLDTVYELGVNILSQKGIGKPNIKILDFYRITKCSDYKKFMITINRLRTRKLIPNIFYVAISNIGKVHMHIKATEEELLALNYAYNNVYLTADEQRLVIKYLQDNNIPATRSTFMEAYEEYVQGKIKTSKFHN